MTGMSGTNGIEKLKTEIERHMRSVFADVISKKQDYRRVAEEYLSEPRAEEQLAQITRFIPFSLEGKRLLDIGSGYGVFLSVTEDKTGANVFGLEPAPQEFFGTINGCKMFFNLKGKTPSVVSADGEAIPFKDNSFDVICSFNAIEHSRNPERVIDETVRVLAPGGYAVLTFPNYGSWWEGHYGILWFPNIPKWLAKLYVRLYGRNPSFIDTLQLLNVKQVTGIMSKHQSRVKLISLGKETWKERLITLDFTEWAALGKLKRILHFIHTLRLHHAVAYLGSLLNWQTPIILVFQKHTD
jgi:SAM-dependent methyltransferase